MPRKYRILFIHAGPVPPNRDPQKNLQFHISGICEGDLVSTHWGRPEDYRDRSVAEVYDTLGSFHYHATFSTRVRKPLKLFWDLGYYVRMGLGLSKSKGTFDVIVTYGPFTCSIAGWIISRLTGAKLVVEVPGPPTDGFLFEKGLLSKIKLHVARTYVPSLLRRADGVRLYYPSQLEGLKGGEFPPAFVFPDLVPVSVISSMEEVKNNRDGRYILFLGCPFNRKGVDILLKAFNRISSKHREVSLKVVGYCPDLAPYQELAGGNPRIGFHPGVSHEQAMALMANCTFFVLPSRAEGVPRALIEAMAAGKPVVATRVSGIPFIIEDGSNGLLAEPESIDHLASQMDRLLSDPVLAQHLAEEGHRRALHELSEARYVEQFREMVEKLLEEGDARGKGRRTRAIPKYFRMTKV
jgi:glycosyltransferase involved in cell wall biosynthesis